MDDGWFDRAAAEAWGPVVTRELTRRMDTLESAVRSLSRREIARFARVGRESPGGSHEWAPDRRFWFDGTADLTLTRDEEGAIRELWTRMNAGLVFAVTGREVGAWIDRPGVFARLDRIGPRGRQVEGAVATILEREMGGEVWLVRLASGTRFAPDFWRTASAPRSGPT